MRDGEKERETKREREKDRPAELFIFLDCPIDRIDLLVEQLWAGKVSNW